MLEAPDLNAGYEEAVRCNRCGFCQATCPTYQVTGQESNVARGRNALTRAMVEGDVEKDPKLELALAECLLCGACTDACFPAVRTNDLVVRARSRYQQEHGQSALQRFALRQLLPNPELMTRLARMLSFGKRTGLSGVAQVFRRLGTFGKHLAHAEAFVDHVPTRFLRDRLKGMPLRPGRREHRVAYFIGCGINFALPDAGMATVRVLQAMHCEPVVLDHVCCGLPAYACGDMEAARALAKRNVAQLAGLDVDVIVTDCASCASFLKDYPTLLADGTESAAAVATKVRDITQLVAELGPPEGLKTIRQNVTYHRPCHQVRFQRLGEEPIRMLESAPGVTHVPLPEADWCCGGAGSYSVAHHELSMKVLARKMGNVASTGADVLSSCCPSCLLQLSHGVRRHGLPVTVRHVSELLADRLPSWHGE